MMFVYSKFELTIILELNFSGSRTAEGEQPRRLGSRYPVVSWAKTKLGKSAKTHLYLSVR